MCLCGVSIASFHGRLLTGQQLCLHGSFRTTILWVPQWALYDQGATEVSGEWVWCLSLINRKSLLQNASSPTIPTAQYRNIDVYIYYLWYGGLPSFYHAKFWSSDARVTLRQCCGWSVGGERWNGQQGMGMFLKPCWLCCFVVVCCFVVISPFFCFFMRRGIQRWWYSLPCPAR